MRATISRYIHALKQRRSSDEGFSLIELIVVVAILGILIAIAIPVFGAIQASARTNAVAAAAAHAATAVTAALADNDPASTVEAALTNASNDDITVTAAGVDEDSTLDEVCVTASAAGWDDVDDVDAGPGC